MFQNFIISRLNLGLKFLVHSIPKVTRFHCETGWSRRQYDSISDGPVWDNRPGRNLPLTLPFEASLRYHLEAVKLDKHRSPIR